MTFHYFKLGEDGQKRLAIMTGSQTGKCELHELLGEECREVKVLCSPRSPKPYKQAVECDKKAEELGFVWCSAAAFEALKTAKVFPSMWHKGKLIRPRRFEPRICECTGCGTVFLPSCLLIENGLPDFPPGTPIPDGLCPSCGGHCTEMTLPEPRKVVAIEIRDGAFNGAYVQEGGLVKQLEVVLVDYDMIPHNAGGDAEKAAQHEKEATTFMERFDCQLDLTCWRAESEEGF